jgi:hypothetical protein
MSRRLYRLGVGLALVALALGFTDWALSLRPGVTEANFRRIRPGMKVAEVEAILRARGGRIFDGANVFLWGDDAGVVWVWTDDHGRVVSAKLSRWGRSVEQSGLLTRLRAWLGW